MDTQVIEPIAEPPAPKMTINSSVGKLKKYLKTLKETNALGSNQSIFRLDISK